MSLCCEWNSRQWKLVTIWHYIFKTTPSSIFSPCWFCCQINTKLIFLNIFIFDKWAGSLWWSSLCGREFISNFNVLRTLNGGTQLCMLKWRKYARIFVFFFNPNSIQISALRHLRCGYVTNWVVELLRWVNSVGAPWVTWRRDLAWNRISNSEPRKNCLIFLKKNLFLESGIVIDKVRFNSHCIENDPCPISAYIIRRIKFQCRLRKKIRTVPE